MGVVGPEGMSQVCRINRLHCLTVPGALKRGLALRGKCLTQNAYPSPFSTRRRMASDRFSDRSCSAAQASILASASGVNRRATSL